MVLAERIVELIALSHKESKAYIDSLFANAQKSVTLRKAPSKVVNSSRAFSSTISRFNRLVFTPLHSRVMLFHFGSKIHELIDKNMDFVWKIKLKKYLYESFFNENLELWDRDFDPKEIRIVDADAESGEVSVSVTFKNGMEIGFNV